MEIAIITVVHVDSVGLLYAVNKQILFQLIKVT